MNLEEARKLADEIVALRERVRELEDALRDVYKHIVWELPRTPGYKGMQAAIKAKRLLDAASVASESDAPRDHHTDNPRH